MNVELFNAKGICIELIPASDMHNITRVTWQDEEVLGYINEEISKDVAEDIAFLLHEVYTHGKFSAYYEMKNFTKTKLRRYDDE